jgi:hypothetical protein
MQAIRHGTMLPSLQRNEIGTSELEPVSQLNTWPVVPPVNASRRPRGTPRIIRGRDGWLVLTPWGTFTSYSLPAFLAHSALGPSRLGRAASKPSHARYAAESGSKFRAASQLMHLVKVARA